MKFGLASPGKRRCESVGMAPTHGVYALRHALFSLLVCQPYRSTATPAAAPCAGSGAFTTEFRGPGPPCTLLRGPSKSLHNRLTSLGVHGVTLETIVRTATGYLTVTSPPSEAESLQ